VSGISDQYSNSRVALIIFSLAIGGFGIGIGEFALMGLMPLVSSDLSVSEPQVGHLVSIYALGVVVGAPLCALVGAKFSRKNLLISLMVFYSVSNAAIALVEGYEMLLVFRFVAGLPHGAFFGIAALLSASLVNKNMRAKAVSFTMMGLTLALLIGNPLASLIAQNLHWRYVFAFISVNALITVLLIYFSLPIVKGGSKSGALSEVRSFNNPAIWYPLAIGSIGFAGMFCVLSYLAPTLLNVTNVSPIWIPIVLFVFGLGGFLGNILGGWLFDRLNFYSIGWILFASVCILLIFPVASSSLFSMLLICFSVGLMVALAPALQTHLMDVAVGAQSLAAASHQAAFNLANALGPWFGGIAIGMGFGWESTGYVGAATATAGLVLFFMGLRYRSKMDQAFAPG